jgi:hypothetical protein
MKAVAIYALAFRPLSRRNKARSRASWLSWRSTLQSMNW